MQKKNRKFKIKIKKTKNDEKNIYIINYQFH